MSILSGVWGICRFGCVLDLRGCGKIFGNFVHGFSLDLSYPFFGKAYDFTNFLEGVLIVPGQEYLFFPGGQDS